MALTAKDITLDNFLLAFTYTGDPDPKTKTELPLVDFLNISSQLAILNKLEQLRLK